MLCQYIIHTLRFFIVKFTVYVEHECGWVCVRMCVVCVCVCVSYSLLSVVSLFSHRLTSEITGMFPTVTQIG